MTDDPRPEMRCRCVHRMTLPGSDHEFSFYGGADPYYDRCRQRPSEEDGLCDHCRGGIRPLSDEPWQRIGECVTCGPDWRCCLHPTQRRRLVDLTEPCLCGHGASLHGTSGRCGSTACGCIRLRPSEKATAPRPAAAAPVLRGLPELVVCPACAGTGNALSSTDPDFRWWWCGTCWGVGRIEVAQ